MGRLNRAVTWLRTVAQPGLFTFLQVISAALRMAPFSFGMVFCCILGCMSQNLCFHFGFFHFHLLQIGDEKVSGGDFKIQLNFTGLSFGIIFVIPWIIFMADRILFVQTVFPNQFPQNCAHRSMSLLAGLLNDKLIFLLCCLALRSTFLHRNGRKRFL